MLVPTKCISHHLTLIPDEYFDKTQKINLIFLFDKMHETTLYSCGNKLIAIETYRKQS